MSLGANLSRLRPSHRSRSEPAKPFSLQNAFIVASSLNVESLVSVSLLLPIWKFQEQLLLNDFQIRTNKMDIHLKITL